MQSAIEALQKKIETEERRIGDMNQVINEGKKRLTADAAERELALGRVQVYRAAIAKLETKSVDVKIVPASGEADYNVKLGDLFVAKSVFDNVLRQRDELQDTLQHHRSRNDEMDGIVARQSALLVEKDHRIVAQEQRIREMEEALAEVQTKPCLTADTLLTDPAVAWVIQMAKEGHDACDRGVQSEQFYNTPAVTLGGLVAGFGYDARRLAHLLPAIDELKNNPGQKGIVNPGMASDHANAAWIFQTLEDGWHAGYNKTYMANQQPNVKSKLWHFGHRAGKAQRKVDKRRGKDASIDVVGHDA